jgi:hypothetical protein
MSEVAAFPLLFMRTNFERPKKADTVVRFLVAV